MHNFTRFEKLIYVFVLCFCASVSSEFSCKDENNNDLDWFLNYKIPQIEDEPRGSVFGQGVAYAFLSSARSTKWKLSTQNISSSSSMLGNTLRMFYANKEDATYLMYNDAPPDGFSGSAAGHLKGVLAFDKQSGFWLIHSMPKFPGDEYYSYPDNAQLNGQNIFCITFKTTELDEICNQLLYSNPLIYSKQLTPEVEELLGDKARSLFSEKPDFIRKPPFTRLTDLKSVGNKRFKSFAKDNQLNTDLYGGILAPELKVPLTAETWRRGSGGVLPPACDIQYDVTNVLTVSMDLTYKGRRKTISFSYLEDHSKWAISEDGNKSWVCIADLNRMESQEKRGGGALCFQTKQVWRAYDSIISERDQCKSKK